MERKIIYPHYILLVKKIATWLLFFTAPLTLGILYLVPAQYQFKSLIGLGAISAFLVIQTALNYTSTLNIIEEAGIMIKKGWIPNTQDSIFWIHIKDINSTAGGMESLFGCGTIILKVNIRNGEETIRIEFIPKYNEIFNLIRSKIADINKDARAVTYS